MFVCLELQRDNVNCTYGGREQNYTRAGETFLGRVPKLSINIQEILSRTQRNFESKIKYSGSSMDWY